MHNHKGYKGYTTSFLRLPSTQIRKTEFLSKAVCRGEMKAVRGQAAEVGKLWFPGASLNLLPRGVLNYEHHNFVSSTARSLAIIPLTCQLLTVGQLVRVGGRRERFPSISG